MQRVAGASERHRKGHGAPRATFRGAAVREPTAQVGHLDEMLVDGWLTSCKWCSMTQLVEKKLPPSTEM